MTRAARERILQRLRAAAVRALPAGHTACPPVAAADRAQRQKRFTELMRAMRTHVEIVGDRDWVDRLKTLLKEKKLQSLLYAPETDIGRRLETRWPADDPDLPALCAWQGSVEDFKAELFQIDAAITATVGAVADTGAIVLWPDAKEPRLMSLVPPLHIALLQSDRIYNSFDDIIRAGNWPDGMPTNALLISGPSKTADIEMTLAFGVHGPRELIVIIANP
ncbi:MAG: lactate utilization protein [Desulfobacteraceae bacterium]|jgi:L-lactate dehydrogenase complex protein LldG